jgi:hypothetical protein
MPTFTTVFHFTASKSKLFCQQLWRWGWFGNVAGQQPQPSQWTLPPKPQRHVVHALIGPPYQTDAGTGWAWATTIHACRETKLLLTIEDWTQFTIALAWPQSHEMPMSRVFSRRREVNGDNQMCQVLRSAFCWPHITGQFEGHNFN